MKLEIKKYIARLLPIFCFWQVNERSWFRVELHHGDGKWPPSIWITFWWFGRHYWLLVFLN